MRGGVQVGVVEGGVKECEGGVGVSICDGAEVGLVEEEARQSADEEEHPHAEGNRAEGGRRGREDRGPSMRAGKAVGGAQVGIGLRGGRRGGGEGPGVGGGRAVEQVGMGGKV